MPVILVVAFIPIESRLKYIGLEEDCMNRGIWIYDRLYNNQNPIDVAFIGSSKIINGINDGLINEQLGNKSIANFGYCRLGRNLHYTIIKELLNSKNPSLLLLEVRETENRSGHEIFPFIANSTDALLPYPFFNKHVARNTWTHLSYKVELFQESIFETHKEVPISAENFSFVAATDTADALELNQKKSNYKMNDFEKRFHYHYPLTYLRKIALLCKEQDVQLQLLFMPNYGTDMTSEVDFEPYSEFGTILVPPKSILQNVNHWYDKAHLNEVGANQLSYWLSEEIAAIVTPKSNSL